MPVLNKKWFGETGEFTQELARHVNTAGMGHPINLSLTNLGWKGQLVAGIGIELTPDNSHISRGEFFLRGVPTKDFVDINATDLWPTATEGTILSVMVPDTNMFRFSSGTLVSEYVHSEHYRFFFKRGSNTLVPSEWAAHNVGDTTIRAVVHLDKTSNSKAGPRAKTTFLIFPNSAEDMADLSDSTQSPAWPGFRVLETTCDFFPKVAEWRDPICPLIIHGSDPTNAPNLPPGQEFRFHVAAIMKSAKRPTTCTNRKALHKQWTKALDDIEQLEQDPTITWPTVIRHQPTIGNQSQPFLYSSNCLPILTLTSALLRKQ